jgi:uncharacterized protein (TIGR02246 family)
MKTRLTILTVALTAATCLTASAHDVNAPLLDRTKQFVAAVKAKDAAKVAACYTENAVWMPPNGPRVNGQKAIQDHARRLFQDSPSSDVELTPLASQIAGDLAFVQGEFVTSGKRANGQFVREKGNYVWILKNVAGEWRISHDIFNSTEPPPAAPPAPKPPAPPKPPQK